MRKKRLRRFSVANLGWGQALKRGSQQLKHSVLGGVVSSLHHFLPAPRKSSPVDGLALGIIRNVYGYLVYDLLTPLVFFFFLYTCHLLSLGCYHFSLDYCNLLTDLHAWVLPSTVPLLISLPQCTQCALSKAILTMSFLCLKSFIFFPLLLKSVIQFWTLLTFGHLLIFWVSAVTIQLTHSKP